MTAKRPTDNLKREIHVTCAIIRRKGLILAAQRGERMDRPLQWEFPGGKMRDGETPEECICREILEELDIVVRPIRVLPSGVYEYSDLAIRLTPILCAFDRGMIRLKEHKSARWLPSDKLSQLNWTEADVPIVHALTNGLY